MSATAQVLLKCAYELRDKLQKELEDDYFNKTLLGHHYHISTLNNHIEGLKRNNMSVTTQRFLNWLNKPTTPLVEDGVIGAKSQEQIRIALNRLAVEFSKRGWIWDKVFNFIGIRTDNDFDDTFEDWFVLTVYDTIIAVPCSTVAGVQAINKYWYRWIRGRQGVGCIVENQQIDYLLVEPNASGNSWINWTGGLGYLYQDKPISVYRGAIKDGSKWITNKLNPLHNDTGGGFNVHSWAGYLAMVVGSLSDGCQVTTVQYWKIIFPILVKNARIVDGQKRVTYSLMQF